MALNDQDVSRQIQQMVAFIEQEAEEKASEIMVKAEEEFNIEKSRMVQAEKIKITAEYERKEKQVEVEKRIALSNEVNQARLKILRLRDEITKTVFDNAKAKLSNLTSNKSEYKILLKDLVVEGLLKLLEDKVQILCREVDLALVEEVIPNVVKEYKEKTGKDMELKVNKKHFLFPPPNPKQPEANSCSGGIKFSVARGKIMIDNTLDQRMDLVIAQQLPRVRNMLFAEQRDA